MDKAQARRPRRFVWRSFLLLVLLLHPTISFSFHTSPQSHLNITPYYPFNLATPTLLLPPSTSSRLSLCHVNKWWPSWHDCKFVSSEIKTLRERESERQRERAKREREKEREIMHLCCAEGHIWESVHAADGTGARARRAPQHACTQAAAVTESLLSHRKSQLSKLNNSKLD